MKIMISGHRKSKLLNYSEDWIKLAITDIFDRMETTYLIGLSGMADGVDLWFCEELRKREYDYHAYIPFESQADYMSTEDKILREDLIKSARHVFQIRNSYMVEACNRAIIVWDGNKGGTHNVLQQIIESKKPFWWVNPVKEKVYYLD